MSEPDITTKGQKPKTYRPAVWSFGLAVLGCAIFVSVSILLVIPSLQVCLEWLTGFILLVFFLFSGSYLVSIVLSLISVFKIRKNKGKLKGMGFAIATVLIDISVAATITIVAVFVVQPVIHRTTCGMNLEGIGKALQIYANDYDNKYPTSNKWCDLLIQHAEITESSFCCPSAKKGHSHYAINPNCEPNSPPDVVLVFETKEGWNQYGGPEILVGDRHWWKGSCVLFNNTHVKFIEKKDLAQLKWKSEDGNSVGKGFSK